ncbi:MAG: hypothetical protein GY896_22360 [Gammaproteobacteria bacterium]|nr:hypothetical protein [Gammaproteobacteria bacterium]
MTHSRLDRFLAPWVFVLTGIVFNVLAAVNTHYFIGLNNDAINVIGRDIQNKQVLIDSLWQSKTETERKREFFVLFLSSKDDKSAVRESYYRDYLDGILKTYELDNFQKRLETGNSNDLSLLFDLSNTVPASIIESINANISRRSNCGKPGCRSNTTTRYCSVSPFFSRLLA